MKNNNSIQFIHANGFPTKAYSSLINKIEKNYNVIPNELFSNEINLQTIKDWDFFTKRFLKKLDNNKKYIGIGHSIGGNIILRSSIYRPDLFSKIILLDPTIFVPRFIFFWKIISLLKMDDYLHPMSKKTLSRKTKFINYDEIFNSYRDKKVFKYIKNENLKLYIDSITKKNDVNEIELTYPKEFEYKIYKTGIVHDNFIWKKLKNIEIPTLFITAKNSNTFLKSAELKIKKFKNQNISIITIDKYSHLFPLEVPEKTARIINDFII
tara:strand:- start:111 stop:911 length:801 start_codon:yes stop_codon:yes gene_type:complete